MFSLIQSQRVRGNAGDPIPTVFKSLEQKGIIFRRGELVLACAGSGTGKSAFTLIETMLSRVPSLYLSADSSAYEQLKRAISIATGMNQDEASLLARSTSLPDEVRAKLSEFPVRFDFEAIPTLDRIEGLMRSYEEVFGDYPTRVVVDNISDVMVEGDEESTHAGQEGLLAFLNDMARKTQACVVGLHHVNASHANGDEPIPLNAIKGQIHRIPAMIVTIHKKKGDGFGPDRLCVSPVKVRGGKADSSGRTFAELEFDGYRMLLQDPPYVT